jgi:hypothetical protein
MSDGYYRKYPKTRYLPWSESIGKGDRYLDSLDTFYNKRVIVTEKLDGQNTSCYNDHIHARSLDSTNAAMDWIKNFWQTFRFDIPDGFRVCGEDVTYRHSIKYDNLETFFYGFSVWNKDVCLSWDETLEWFSLLDIKHVPILYDGIYNEQIIKTLWKPEESEFREGYVLRLAESFSYEDFSKSVGKFVRKNHVTTSEHWLYGAQLEKNKCLISST